MERLSQVPSLALREARGVPRRWLDTDWPSLLRDLSTVDTSQWSPSVDIREEDERFVVEADVPGVDPKDIEVTMEDGVLSIRGERRDEHVEDQGRMRRVERLSGSFYRRFALPDSADPENIRARSENGVLRLEIGKRETARARRIPVQS